MSDNEEFRIKMRHTGAMLTMHVLTKERPLMAALVGQKEASAFVRKARRDLRSIEKLARRYPESEPYGC